MAIKKIRFPPDFLSNAAAAPLTVNRASSCCVCSWWSQRRKEDDRQPVRTEQWDRFGDCWCQCAAIWNYNN